MKKISRPAAVLCLITIIGVMLFAAPASAKGMDVWVAPSNHGKLNLRVAPSADADLVIQLPYGQMVSVLNYVNNTWTYIQANVGGYTYVGYVMSRYLVTEKPSVNPQPIITPAPSGAAVTGINWSAFQSVTPYSVSIRPTKTTGWVNLRWAPSQSVDVIQRMYSGYTMTVIATDGTWAQAYDPATGKVGFFMLMYSTVTARDAVIRFDGN